MALREVPSRRAPSGQVWGQWRLPLRGLGGAQQMLKDPAPLSGWQEEQCHRPTGSLVTAAGFPRPEPGSRMPQTREAPLTGIAFPAGQAGAGRTWSQFRKIRKCDLTPECVVG